jgi:hypothetical protein
MTLTELILKKPGTLPLFRYYSERDGSRPIFKESMIAEGWSASEQIISFSDKDDDQMAAFLEATAYRFYERGLDRT